MTVEDNGQGIPDHLSEEEIVHRQEKKKRPGIGIPNIRERLKMLYGLEDLLTLESTSYGTTVKILFPISGKQDSEDAASEYQAFSS